MIARIALALSLIVVIVDGVTRARPVGELRDFGSFIASGQAGAAGQNPYGIYPLTFHVVLPGFDVWNPNLNPPLSVPFFGLLARMEPQRAFVLWWCISLISYVTAVVLLCRRYWNRSTWLLGLWAMALAGMWDTLALGQIYLPLVLVTVGAWLLLERGYAVGAGVFIGLLVAVKPNFAVWPALLLLAGHWRAPVTSAVTASVLWVIPLVTLGAGVYRQWMDLILSDSGRAAFLTNASLPGLAQRLDVGLAGTVVSVLLLVGSAVWVFRYQPSPLRTSTLGILGGIAASPLAWVHYTLFLLPLFFSRRWTPTLAAAAVLLTVPVSVVLRFVDAPLWQQATIGSVYNWAVLLCLAGLIREGLQDARSVAQGPTFRNPSPVPSTTPTW